MNDSVQEIKKKIDIVEFIGSYVSVKKAGRNFKANCPFHQEKSPSFVISPDRQIWHCFGSCHEGGDAIKFLMKWENISFVEAVKDLAARVGVSVDFGHVDDEKAKQRDGILTLNLLAAKYYHYIFAKTKQGERARSYVADHRGISDKVAQTFQIGYAPSSWDSLLSYLRSKNHTDVAIEQAGLALRSAKTGKLYDRFRGRVMFPIQDARGNVVGFSGRVLEGEGDGAKYINSPETPVYHKRETLYGIYQAKEGIKKHEYTLLVEGEFDVIAPFQHGIDNIVAVKGSAITQEQLMLLKRYAPKIVFAMDADGSGADAVRRGALEADKLDMECEVLSLEDGNDPDEAVRNNLIAFKKSLSHTQPVYDFLFDVLSKRHNIDDPYGKKRIIEGIVEHLAHISNPIIQSHYIKKFSSALEVSESSVESALSKRRRGVRDRSALRKNSKEKQPQRSREDLVEQYVMSLLLQGAITQEMGKVFEVLESADFVHVVYQKLFDAFATYHHQENKDVSFADSLPAELLEAYNEAYLYAAFDETFSASSIMRLVYEVKRNSLKRQIKSQLSKNDDEEAVDIETKTLSILQKQLTEVEKHVSSL